MKTPNHTPEENLPIKKTANMKAVFALIAALSGTAAVGNANAESNGPTETSDSYGNWIKLDKP